MNSFRGGIIALTFLLHNAVSALSYSPEAFLSWEEVVAKSDFAGVIECVRAGARVSEFKVVEAWKGEIAGPTFRLGGAPRVGDRFVACLRPFVPDEYYHPDHLPSLLQPVGGAEVLRGIWQEAPSTHSPSDPLVWSVLGFDPDTLDIGRTFEYDGHLKTLDRYKAVSLVVINSTGEAREALLIASALRSLIVEPTDPEALILPRWIDTPQRGEGGLDDLLAAMLDPQGGLDRKQIGWALSRAGGEITLGKLAQWNYSSQADADWLAEVVKKLRERLAADVNPPRVSTPHPLDWSPNIRADKKRLRQVPVNREDFIGKEFTLWCDAFERLTAKRPKFVAEYLKTFDSRGLFGNDATQNLGVWFAVRCSEERAACFQLLMASDDPTNRAIGAAFLAFEDPKQGVPALERLAGEEDLIRYWAAYTLVAHGRKEYVPLALEGFPGDWEKQVIRRPWEAFLPALSNAAADSNLPQPGGPHWRGVTTPEGREELVAWWAQYGEQVNLKPLAFQWPPVERR